VGDSDDKKCDDSAEDSGWERYSRSMSGSSESDGGQDVSEWKMT